MKNRSTKKGRMDMSQRALSVLKKATGIDSLTNDAYPKKAAKKKLIHRNKALK